MSGEWTPNENEFIQGQLGYVQYIGGLMIANQPDSVYSQGLCQRELTPENEVEMLTHAVKLMYDGCRSVIKFSNPPSNRKGIIMEKQFGLALPHMMRIIKSTWSEDFEQFSVLKEQNPSWDTFRPQPMTNATVYQHLCHPRLEKLKVNHLMGQCLLAKFFNKDFANQTLNLLIGHGANYLGDT